MDTVGGEGTLPPPAGRVAWDGSSREVWAHAGLPGVLGYEIGSEATGP